MLLSRGVVELWCLLSCGRVQQCRAPPCRRMMMEGLLPRPSADAIADADDLDRKKGLTKCTKARYIV